MKNKIASVSPFIMLIIPVLLFVGLSLALKDNANNEEFAAGTDKNKFELNVSEASLLSLILRK